MHLTWLPFDERNVSSNLTDNLFCIIFASHCLLFVVDWQPQWVVIKKKRQEIKMEENMSLILKNSLLDFHEKMLLTLIENYTTEIWR